MGIRASKEARGAKDAGRSVGGVLRGRKPRARETVNGGREEIVEGSGREVSKGKVSGIVREPIASANDSLVR